MVGIIVNGLKKLATWIDQAVPGQGARTITTVVLVVVGNVALFLTGQVTPEGAAQNILDALQALLNSLGALAAVFASKHQPATPPKP